ncbi:Uncharacterised protein [uncultured archaeon]|nr:Uncharacterised protein [uncultured archaeon]
MIKSEKPKIKEDLLDKKRILDIRIKTFERQENSLTEQLEKSQEEISASIK